MQSATNRAAGPVLVTGASGFVGSAVARALIARGERVRIIIRASSPRTNIDGLDAEIIVGDLTDEVGDRLREMTETYGRAKTTDQKDG